jgi:hypothetical protein
VLLGDVIADLQEESVAAETILRIGDLALLTELRRRAEESGAALGEYTIWAVRIYADNAPPDEWTTLIGLLERAEDPGATCLNRALGFVLSSVGPPEDASPRINEHG